MEIGRVVGATRKLVPPRNWDAAANGPCAALFIRDERADGENVMVSAWLPSREDIAALAAGAPIFLRIVGELHPPVSLVVGQPPEASHCPHCRRPLPVTSCSNGGCPMGADL